MQPTRTPATAVTANPPVNHRRVHLIVVGLETGVVTAGKQRRPAIGGTGGSASITCQSISTRSAGAQSRPDHSHMTSRHPSRPTRVGISAREIELEITGHRHV